MKTKTSLVELRGLLKLACEETPVDYSEIAKLEREIKLMARAGVSARGLLCSPPGNDRGEPQGGRASCPAPALLASLQDLLWMVGPSNVNPLVAKARALADRLK